MSWWAPLAWSFVGKASSSKKVQRAARAAASSRGAGERRERGFPLLVGLVILLGVGLVVAARGSRDPLVAPLLDDHWHSAFQVYDCGELQPILTDETDPDGIHTHADGLIHIHPFNSSATGDDASLRVFFDSAGVSMTDTTISSRDFDTVDASTGCDGADAELVVARWKVDGDDGVRLDTPELVATYPPDPGSIRFLEDREAFTLAKVPVGEDPPPPSDSVLDQLDASTGTTNIASQTQDDLAGTGEDPATSVPADGDATTTSAPEDGDTTTTSAPDESGSTTTAPADDATTE